MYVDCEYSQEDAPVDYRACIKQLSYANLRIRGYCRSHSWCSSSDVKSSSMCAYGSIESVSLCVSFYPEIAGARWVRLLSSASSATANMEGLCESILLYSQGKMTKCQSFAW